MTSAQAQATKVLIAHGNTRRLRLAVAELRAVGFDVVATPDGGDAFARFFEEQPRVVVCSTQLPGLSGVSFAEMVRSQSPGTAVFVLIDPTSPPTETIAAGSALREPFTADALRAALPDLPEFTQPVTVLLEGDEAPSLPSSTNSVFALAALKRFQRDNNLLAVLDEKGLLRMAEMAQHQVHGDGERIMKEGDPGDGFYLVVEGQVRVTLAEKGDKEVARINPGGFFGEMAMLSNSKRSASVWTVGPTTLFWFARESFMPLLDHYPTMREVLSGVALKRTEENLWRVLFDDEEVQRSLATLGDEVPNIAAPRPVEEVVEAEPYAELVPENTGAVKMEPSPLAESTSAMQLGPIPSGGASSDRWRWLGLGLALGFSAGVSVMLVVPNRDAPLDLLVAERPVGPTHVASVKAEVAEPASAVPEPALAVAPPAVAQAQAGGEGAPPSAGAPEAAGARPVDAAADPAGAPEAAAPATPTPAPAPATTLTTAAQTPTATDGAPAPATPEQEAERKSMRKDLFSAFKAGNFARAVTVGRKLQGTYAIDWEAELTIARAEHQAGELEPALASYRRFLDRYPRHTFADDAMFYAGEVLTALGRAKEAKVAFSIVASNPKSEHQEAARTRITSR